jgi:hypothetical protein
VRISAERSCFDHWNNGRNLDCRAKLNENDPWVWRWDGFEQKSYVAAGSCMNVTSIISAFLKLRSATLISER